MLTTISSRLKCKRGAVTTVEVLVWVGIICLVLVFVAPKMNTGIQDLWTKSDARIQSLDTILKP